MSLQNTSFLLSGMLEFFIISSINVFSSLQKYISTIPMLIRSFIRSSSILTKLSHSIVVFKKVCFATLAIACVINTSTDVPTIPLRIGTTLIPPFIVIWEVNCGISFFIMLLEPSFITPSAPAPIIFSRKKSSALLPNKRTKARVRTFSLFKS